MLHHTVLDYTIRVNEGPLMSITDEELIRRAHDLLDEVDPKTVDQVTFRGAQYDAGLAWLHFPPGFGGLGLSRGRQAVVDQVLRAGGNPYHDLFVNVIGIGMGAPTILEYGTEEMWHRHLRPIFTGEHIWCQLFSEPANGSDIAGIPSRAIRDGDDWIVNGQKVWTTLAHKASWAMLLTRTDPDVPKHQGLSYFLLDMTSPGVTVRPLFQLTGDAEFNEIFLNDVRVPHANMLGAPGDGWKVTTTTLMNERVALGGGSGGKGGGPIRTLMRVWESRRDQLPPSQRAVLRDQVADLWVRAEVLRLNNQRAKDLAATGKAGPGFSIGKLMTGELSQAIFAACVELLGADGMLYPEGYPMKRHEGPPTNGSITAQLLRSRANTIEGGTSEIQRNILGEKILGLPGDIRVDKGIPWRDLAK
jgi:alkylation response protein AidB-like acyl-CoA dehydrogenase